MNVCIDWEFPLRDEDGAALDLADFDVVEARFAAGPEGALRTQLIEDLVVLPGSSTGYLHTKPGFFPTPGRWSLRVYLRSMGGHTVATGEYIFFMVQGTPATVSVT
jgi:hypothetical protein